MLLLETHVLMLDRRFKEAVPERLVVDVRHIGIFFYGTACNHIFLKRKQRNMKYNCTTFGNVRDVPADLDERLPEFHEIF